MVSGPQGGALIPRTWRKEVPTERALREETGKEGTAPVQVVSVLTVCWARRFSRSLSLPRRPKAGQVG